MQKRSKALRQVFIETSVFIRFFTNYDPPKATDCQKLFEMVEAGLIRPYISNVVILEIVFVLERLYGFARPAILRAVGKVLELRNVTLIEKTDTRLALDLWGVRPIKYGDCLIASQIPKELTLVTYDTDFKKLRHTALSPSAIID